MSATKTFKIFLLETNALALAIGVIIGAAVGKVVASLVKDIPVGDVEEGFPALLTMILMPLTYDITVGIGAGFVSWVGIKVIRGGARDVHPLMWLVATAFVVYFLQDWLLAFGASTPV